MGEEKGLRMEEKKCAKKRARWRDTIKISDGTLRGVK